MPFTGPVLMCLLGLGLLIAGGEGLTAASSRLARRFGVRPIIIGLTIVAFGTSTPEAFVSLFAALEQKPDIAIANVVGSNIFNIAFILGLAALIHPLRVESGSLKREVPFVVGSAALLWLMAQDGYLSRVDGLLLLVFFGIFMAFCFRDAGSQEDDGEEPGDRKENPAWLGLKIALSLFLLALGANLLVSGSTALARGMGVSELLIGLTIVAAGTSLPELATSVMAAIRRKDDIAVGNVTGSNVFNILFILGLTAVIYPLNVNEGVLSRDIPLMLLVSLVSVPILKSGFIISRLEGAVLLAFYAGYSVLLFRAG